MAIQLQIERYNDYAWKRNQQFIQSKQTFLKIFTNFKYGNV